MPETGNTAAITHAARRGAQAISRRRRLVLAGAALIAALGLAAFTLAPQNDTIPVYSYEVVRVFPHDPEAFTQGLFYRDGYFYESTGLYGRSTIRKVEPETGKVVQMQRLPAQSFGEGISDWGDRLIGLTWQEQRGFVWDLESFSLRQEFRYSGEGWGLTRSADALVMSDGTATIRFLDPATLSERSRITVTANGRPVDQLNELEWIDGEIFANIWQTDRIARINPATGHVTGWIDLQGLLTSQGPVRGRPDVLNGIAHDGNGRLFVTGKLWPKLFEIRLVRRGSPLRLPPR
ncbi:glutaminyl-peptide cyclotransferase [Phreatobacter stygius]|uniref:Glutaminyl-peptide cyclotransferase n=1 Tax=Phreatobacter stygius TaxID=1940610 RepID=A0A4D7BIN3_9HYPH|nr:glutaminyl-peptide cyclotransferase [Phreatobacter stygius]QCI67637.1 glutaminyl-peptide cyclotransferase [Phreatobacter stygius]